MKDTLKDAGLGLLMLVTIPIWIPIVFLSMVADMGRTAKELYEEVKYDARQ